MSIPNQFILIFIFFFLYGKIIRFQLSSRIIVNKLLRTLLRLLLHIMFGVLEQGQFIFRIESRMIDWHPRNLFTIPSKIFFFCLIIFVLNNFFEFVRELPRKTSFGPFIQSQRNFFYNLLIQLGTVLLFNISDQIH